MSKHNIKSPSSMHYIDGKWQCNDQAKIFYSFNPVDNKIIWQGYSAQPTDIIKAVNAAHQALTSWSLTPIDTRERFIRSFGSIIHKKSQELARLITLETGKPLWEAQTEASAVENKIKLSIQAYHERTGRKTVTQAAMPGHVRYKPLGVVAVLGPFNFPAHLSNGHIVPALIAGNTVVYKPSELAPAVAAFMLECWHESGLPKGVLNVLQGDASTAQTLLAQDLQAVFFTGSYKTGCAIHQYFCERPDVLLALEMGGNSPLLIDEIQDISAACYHTILSTFITTGQRCSCARRLLIPDSAFGDSFLQTFIKHSKELLIGDGLKDPQPFMGPVINYQHALTHLQAQKKLRQIGGQPLLTMRSLAENTGFLSPGIIDMSHVDKIFDEEIFAPLVQVYRYNTFDHALHLANQTKYGLAAGIISDKKAHYDSFFKHMRAGIIHWNRATTGAASNMPFGGVGHSGNYRPGAYYAADYCAYPIASLEQTTLSLPDTRVPGLF